MKTTGLSRDEVVLVYVLHYLLSILVCWSAGLLVCYILINGTTLLD